MTRDNEIVITGDEPYVGFYLPKNKRGYPEGFTFIPSVWALTILQAAADKGAFESYAKSVEYLKEKDYEVRWLQKPK